MLAITVGFLSHTSWMKSGGAWIERFEDWMDILKLLGELDTAETKSADRS